MKVGTRLIIGFGTVLVFIFLASLIAYINIYSLNNQIDKLVNDYFPKTVWSNNMAEGANQIARSMRNTLLMSDQGQVQGELKVIEAAQDKIKENLENLQKNIASDKGKDLLKNMSEARNKFMDETTSFLALIRSGKISEAKTLMYERVRPAQQAYMATIDKLSEYQEGMMKDTGQEADKSSQRALLMVIVISGVALLLSALGGFIITRSITKPLLEVVTAAESLTSASEQVSSTAQSLSQASSEQAGSVEETSASLEEMTASIAQNTENSKITEGMASNAANEATDGGKAVKETVEAMKSIAGKISIIDDIAYQTNLLALNAAIEAARAGDHGKGFAVVAAEVRKLAERSQIAAQEIGQLASGSVALAERAGRLLDDMVPAIKKTSDLVQEITAASQEQSSGVGQINVAMSQLNQITQQNASSSEELAATAEEMSSQADQLQSLMASLVGTSKQKPGKRQVRPVKNISVSSKNESKLSSFIPPIANEDRFVKY